MKIVLIVIFVVTSCVSAFSQETIALDGFKNIPCGDFLARMDNLMNEYKKIPDSKIYVVYYGGQHWVERSSWNNKTRSYEKTKLKRTHRDNGLNWAKAIPLYIKDRTERYLTLESGRSRDEFVKENIILIDGGFRKEVEVEIWLVPKGGELPKLSPTVSEKDIKFRKNKPNRTPRMACCHKNC